MSHKIFFVALLILLTVGLRVYSVEAQGPRPGDGRAPRALAGTAFTYQGQLKKSGAFVTSTCNFQFTLWADGAATTQVGSQQNVNSISVANGLFSVPIDFGSNAFTGDARWLRTAVQCGSDGGFISLSLQPLTSVPMALALPGLYTQQNGTSPNLIGGYGRNSVTPGVVGATIAGGGEDFGLNRITDNFGTVGGGEVNRAGDDAGTTGDIPYATVGGGSFNTASGFAATVGGGYFNVASGNRATIGGGGGNIASGSGAFVGGGGVNFAGTTSRNEAIGTASTISGGLDNISSGPASTIGGGWNNRASGSSATVPGGVSNFAAMSYTLAAGRRAKANHDGAFVWGDSTDADIASSAPNQFVVRASGGTRFYGGNNWDLSTTEGDWRVGNDTYRLKIGVAMDGGGAGDVIIRAQGGTNRILFWTPGGMIIYSNDAQTAGVQLAAGGGSWSALSDRNVKANFTAVDGRDILERLATIPIQTWNYNSQNVTVRHIGPMAQDFYAAFSVGEDDKHITTIDSDGVALAAIQGLYQLVQDEITSRDAEIAGLKTQVASQQKQIDSLDARFAALEQAVKENGVALRADSNAASTQGLLFGGLLFVGAIFWRHNAGGKG